MTTALVGATGFVGGNLLRGMHFDVAVGSANSADVRGGDFDLVVFSAARAEKWRINQDPATDERHIEDLESLLGSFTTRRLVVISTVDVYPHPFGVDETTAIDESAQQPYGRHRLRLERSARSLHPHTTVLRLPGLFGPGLKKNVVYDLLNANNVDRLHSDASIQYYDLGRIADDLRRAVDLDLNLVNLATEPITTREVAREVFGLDLDQAPEGVGVARYDTRSVHAVEFGGSDGYLMPRDDVLERMRAFVARERRA